jgi:hypothetical protein
MATCTSTKTVDADPDSVFALLANFADISWIPLATNVRTEGEGPGMRRSMGDEGARIVEELYSLDPASRSIGYGIVGGNPLPIERQDVVATVRPSGATSEVTWEVEYEPDSAGPEVESMIDGIYEMMAGWLSDALA